MKAAKQAAASAQPDTASRMTAAEAAVAALVAHGIDTVYALPGVHNDDLFDALFRAQSFKTQDFNAQDRIRTVHVRHEQGAAYMALGAALATGKPQVYSVVPGPGLLNSAAALLTAYGMNAPVLALIGQIPQAAIGRGLGHLHEIRDQAGIVSRLVDFSARIRAPQEAAPLIAAALRAMGTGRPGPSTRMRSATPRAASPPPGARSSSPAAARRTRRSRSPSCRGSSRRRWSPIGAAAACSTAAIR